MKLTPEHNVEALVTRAREGIGTYQAIIARHCDACGERHDPDLAPTHGARYFSGGRWLCAECHCM